ncbi:hypothetical protein AB8Z38_06720 [Bradyrhizobium sp. LLZ17]|uniref:Uncharacterized protein n=1 Tax=Bradyrhizobium sp. LLZ17 TaxID=3239388 RepID=A0AB39XMG6_9BRAD
MSWLDTLKGRAQEAKAKPAEARPAPKPRQRREIKLAWFQTAAPSDRDECGAVEAVRYFVADGVVTICDERGKPTGKTAVLAERDEPGAIAARMGRAGWIASGVGGGFNRPIQYRPLGIA